MKPGDLIMFAWPFGAPRLDKLDWENARIGLVIDVTVRRPNDTMYGDELLILHEGERWSVPSKWCRPIKEDQ